MKVRFNLRTPEYNIAQWQGLILPCTIHFNQQKKQWQPLQTIYYFLEDTRLDVKKLYTPKEWTERLQHFIKRIYDIGKKPALPGKAIQTNNRWTEKVP